MRRPLLLAALSLTSLLLACPATVCEPEGEPVVHQGTISADETWPSGIHHLTGTVTVGSGATLTLSRCSVLRLDPDVGLELSSSAARLVAEGTLTEPIRFIRADPSQAWGNLFVFAPATASLSHVLLEGGGGTETDLSRAQFAGAALAARGGAALPQVLTVNEVAVTDATGIGVFMLNARFATGSAGLTVSGAGWYPLYTGANALNELPAGSYTGNAVDEILLQSVGPAGSLTDAPLIADVTIRNPGVPYRVGTSSSSIVVGDSREESPSALLTIEAGVTLKFSPQESQASQLWVTGKYVAGHYVAQGALKVNGTAAAPVRFTSAAPTPSAGNWGGLYFHHVVDPRTSITHAEIEYAGADSSTVGLCKSTPGASNYDADCSLILNLDDGESPSAFVTQTRFAHGLGCGVYRGWRDAQVDFVSTNQFVDLTGCPQTGVAPTSGTCPDCSL